MFMIMIMIMHIGDQDMKLAVKTNLPFDRRHTDFFFTGQLRKGVNIFKALRLRDR